ncbi:MAG: PP2C family protein-serine/threonine phosphatase, partial [Chloroflexota bacterium]
DPNTAVETIANMTIDIMGIEQCGVLMWNKERELFQGARIAGGPSDLSRAFDRVSLAPASWVPLSSIVETARPVMLAGAEALNELPDELFDYFGLEGWLLLLPLLGADDLIGVMLVSGDKDDLESMRHRIHLLGGIAGQATMAIENAQLHQSRQEEAFVTTALLQVSEAVNRLTQLEDVLETIARLTPLLTGASEVALYYQTVPSNICALGGYYGLGSNLDRVRQAKFEFAAGQDGSLGDQGEVEIIIPPTVQSAFSTESVHSILLSSRGTLVGVMLVAFPDSNGQIGARTASLLRGIGHQASTAIEADRLLQESVERERIEQELLVARDIQTSFLPRSFPQEDGWSVGYTWSAARQVAGDFYDFYQLPDDKGGHRWAFVIADVADKGVPAALYMALARTLIRTVGNNQSDPANCLMRVNELLLKDAQSDLFVSVVYVIWNPETGVVRYANAGHDPPLYLRENGSVDVLRHHDRVLGILPVTDLETTELKLAPGEALVLYTDGITEANDESGKEYTRLGLMKAIADYRSKSANEMITRIMADVLKHSGSVDPHDDQTLVIIKRDAATET